MSSQHSSSDLPSFVPDRGVLNWVSVVAGYDHNSQPKLCARLVLMHDASIYAVHYCFCGFGEVVPFNILTPVNSEHGDYYQRSGRTESVIIIPHYKTPDAKVNMTSPVYSASNQEQNVYIQLDPFDTFNDYFISRKFLSQNAPSLDSINESDHARVVKVLGNICNEENVPYSQRFVLRFPDGKVLELPTNVSAIAGLGTRVASTNYGEVRVGEILFRTGNPDKLIFSRRREIPEYFAIKVVNLIFIRQVSQCLSCLSQCLSQCPFSFLIHIIFFISSSLRRKKREKRIRNTVAFPINLVSTIFLFDHFSSATCHVLFEICYFYYFVPNFILQVDNFRYLFLYLIKQLFFF